MVIVIVDLIRVNDFWIDRHDWSRRLGDPHLGRVGNPKGRILVAIQVVFITNRIRSRNSRINRRNALTILVCDTNDPHLAWGNRNKFENITRSTTALVG